MTWDSFLAKQGRISILKYTQYAKTKLLVTLSQRTHEEYIFLKSISDTEIRRETSEMEDCFLTPPWVGGTPPSPGPPEDCVQSAPRPSPPALQQYASILSPLPASLIGILPMQSHRASQPHAQKGTLLSVLLSNIEFLNNFLAKSLKFSFCTSQIVQTHKLCSGSSLH